MIDMPDNILWVVPIIALIFIVIGLWIYLSKPHGLIRRQLENGDAEKRDYEAKLNEVNEILKNLDIQIEVRSRGKRGGGT